MDEIKIDEKMLKVLAALDSDIWSYPLWDRHYSCFPKDSNGFYAVYPNEDSVPLYVEPPEISKYGWIGINSYEIYSDPEYEIGIVEERYNGINDKGIALVVIEMTAESLKERSLKPKPTIMCQWKNRVHAMYRLENFMPKNTSKLAKWTFGDSIRNLEMSTDGKYVCGRPILNPFSPKVILLNSTDNIFQFEKLRNTYAPSEKELKMRREAGRRRQAEAARRTSAKRKNKSLDKILAAIKEMKCRGEVPNQTKVAKCTGLNRRTVLRHWPSDAVQKLLKSL